MIWDLQVNSKFLVADTFAAEILLETGFIN